MADVRPIHASDLRNHARCPRRAAYARTEERQPARPGTAAALGDLVHAAMERYITAGTLPDDGTRHGRLALELVPHVPADVLGAEVPFAATWRGIPIAGTIDVVGHSTIVDWKTTSGRMLETLAGEPQPSVYAHAFRSVTGRDPECRWVYVHTRTGNVRRLVGRASPLDHFGREIEEVLRHDAAPDAAPMNPRACGDYGGCPYVARCGTQLEALTRGA